MENISNDLKALRDEIDQMKMFSVNDIVARLTSIIEQNEKERAFIEAAKVFCEWRAEGDWMKDVASGGARLEQLRNAYRALTERAKD